MPDNNATAGDNAGNNNSADTSTANQNEGSNQSNTSNDNKQAEGAQSKTFTQDEVNSLLAKERKAAEKKAADAEAKTKLSDDERTIAERDEARAALKERDTRDAVIEQVGRDGVKNPKLFYNAYKSEIETDAAGKITNLKDVLAAAKIEAPELFAEIKKADGSADGGAGKSGTDTKPEFTSAHDRMRYAYEQSNNK